MEGKVCCRHCGKEMYDWKWDGQTFASAMPLLKGDYCRECALKEQKGREG